MLLDYFKTLLNGKAQTIPFWNALLLIKRDFTSEEDIDVPQGKVLQMHSPRIDGELKVDGEVFIE